MNSEKNYDELSKIRALKLWDTGDINRIEIGTFEGLRLIHDKCLCYPVLDGIFLHQNPSVSSLTRWVKL